MPCSSSRTTAWARRTALGLSGLVLALSGCFYNLDRGVGLNPGDVVGVVLLEDGSPAPFARVVVDGTPRNRRAGADGAFVVHGLDAGTWSLAFDYDSDGDGWPEGVARRVVTITVDAQGELSKYFLGDVTLERPSSLRGSVSAPAGVSVGGTQIALVRTVDLNFEDTPFSADQGVEARVGAGADGRFYFPALLSGDVTLRAQLRAADGALYASEPVPVDVALGENSLGDAIVLALVPESPATAGDVFPVGTAISDIRREAVLYAAPRADANERIAVDVSPIGVVPPPPDFSGPRVFSNVEVLTLPNVPIGALDVYVRTDLGRQGVLYDRQVNPGVGRIEWGLIQIGDLACPNADCDDDGVRGLPAQSAAPALWDECTEQCRTGQDFDISNVARARCTVDGTTYDCEDDGDGQPDVTEPTCYGVGLGADPDGDRICTPVDPYPFCAFNDDRCDPDDVTGHYGRETPIDPDGGVDAGPPDGGIDGGIDGGFDGGFDGGVDAGPPDGGVDGGPNDGGLNPEFLPGLTQLYQEFSLPDEFWVDDAGGYILFGDVGEKGGTPEIDFCTEVGPGLSRPTGYAARLDVDGNCERVVFFGTSGDNSARSEMTRIGDEFVLTAITSQDMQVGVDASLDPVVETTVGNRMIVTRMTLALDVIDTVVSPYGGAQLDSAPRVMRMVSGDSVVVAATGGLLITFAPGTDNELTTDDSIVMLRFDSAWDLQNIATSGPRTGPVFVNGVAPDSDGMALAVTGRGDAFGTTLGGTVTNAIFRLDPSLALRAVATGEQTLFTGDMVENGGDLFVAARALDSVDGVYVFRRSFAPGAVNASVIVDPAAFPAFQGAVNGVPSGKMVAVDTTKRTLLTSTGTAIQSSAIPLTSFGAPPSAIVSAINVTSMSADSAARTLFYVTGDGFLHRCDLDDCAATTTQLVGSVTAVDVDPVGEKVYMVFNNQYARANYDGSARESLLPGFSGNAFTVDVVRRRLYYTDNTNLFWLPTDVAGTVTLLGATGGVVDAIDVDDVSGRVYFLVNNDIRSIAPEGGVFLTTTISGGQDPTSGLLSVSLDAPALGANDASTSVEFGQSYVVRFPATGAPAVTSVGNAVNGFAGISGLRTQGNAVFFSGSLSGDDFAFEDGTVVRTRNQLDAPSELYVVKYDNQGSTLDFAWATSSNVSADTFVRAFDVDSAGNSHVLGSSRGEGTVGTQRFGGQRYGRDTSFIWRMGPEGDLAPPSAAPAPMVVEADTFLGDEAKEAVPFGGDGFVAIGPTASTGVFYVAFERPTAALSRRYELPHRPLFLEVSPDQTRAAIAFEVDGSFSFEGVTHTVTDGVATIVFDADGVVLGGTFTELNGGDISGLAIIDDGHFAMTFNGNVTLGSEAGPTSVGHPDATVARYDPAATLIDFAIGSGQSNAVAMADDTSVVVLVSDFDAEFGASLLQARMYDPDGGLQWEVSAEPLDGDIRADEVKISRPGGLIAMGIVNEGVFQIGTSTTAFAGCPNLTFNADDENYLVLAISRDGCPRAFAGVRAISVIPEDVSLEIVEGSNNIVVAGPYDDIVDLVSAPDDEVTAAGGGGLYVAAFNHDSNRLKGRALFVADNLPTASVGGFGAYANGRMWLHGVVQTPSGAVFLDNPGTTVAINNGFVWTFDLADQRDDFTN